MSRYALVLLAAGCGRVGFGESSVDAAGDGAVVDAQSGDTADACTAMFCDGFEDLGLAPWGLAADPGGSATRDAAFGFRGASLHVLAPLGTSIVARYVDAFPVVAPADQWVRAYIYAPSSSALDAEPVELTNAAGDYQIVFSLYDTSIDIHGHGIGGDFSVGVVTPPPRDAWSCYELHVHVGAAGAVELYRDGALVVAEPSVDTRPPSGDLARLRVGMPSKDSGVAGSLFVDEVAADTSRVGCL